MKKTIPKLLVLTLFSIYLISCSSTQSNKTDLVIFPAPPDTTRIQFLKAYSTSVDVTGSRSGFERFILGNETISVVGKPYGIAIGKGKFYVCDSQTNSIEIFDFSNKQFDNFKPTGFGEFKKPLNCWIDESGYLYVADYERKDIVIFDDKLNFVKNIGAGQLVKPTDVCVYKDRIYVADLKSATINIYSKTDYSMVNSFPSKDVSDSAMLRQPTNLTVCNDVIYVTDFGSFNVKKYDLNGNFLGYFGTYGNMNGQFVRPKGIASDKDDNIYVVDAGFENVQIFRPDGKLLMFFGGAYKGPGYMYMPAKVSIDYQNVDYFKRYVDISFNLKYLIFVTNQYGPDKISVYGFVEPKN